MFADYAYDYLMQKGYSPYAAAAAVGAFQQESGMDLDPLAVHDNGSGIGIAGWRDPEPGKGRKTNLLNWAKQNKLDPEDIDTQLDYFDHEITNGDEKSVGEMLRNARNINEATDAMVHYERPQGYDAHDVTKSNGYQNRLNNAEELLKTYSGDDSLGSIAKPAIDTTDTSDTSDDNYDLQIDDYPDEENDTFDDETVGHGDKTTGSRVGKALLSVGKTIREQAAQPLDYTPGGENVDVEPPPVQGIPVNQYEQYTEAYADGGVVGEFDINKYFRMLGV